METVEHISSLEVMRQSELDALERGEVPPAPRHEPSPNTSRLDVLTRMVAQSFGASAAAVVAVGLESVWFLSSYGFHLTSDALAGSYFEPCMASDEPLFIEDTTRDPRFASIPSVATGPVRFFAGHIFRSPDGERAGVIAVFDLKPREASPEMREFLRDCVSLLEADLVAAEELDQGAEVQRAMLPKNIHPLGGYQIAGACIPAKSIGGDFFDWYPIDGGLAFTLGDVMGKGVGAGIIAAAVRAVVRSAVRKNNVSTALERAARWLDTDLGEEQTFVTLFHGRLRAADGRLSYADAGHGLSLIVRADGRWDRLSSLDFPLGTLLGGGWVQKRATLHPGDTLVSFSDGVLDLFDGSLATVDEVAAITRECTSAQLTVDALEHLARRDGAPDDVTAIAIRRLS